MKASWCLLAAVAVAVHALRVPPPSKQGATVLSDEHDPFAWHLTAWAELWHKHYTELKSVRLGEMQAALLSTHAATRDDQAAQGVEGVEAVPEADDNSSLSDDARVLRLQQLEDVMKLRLRQYWEHLSNISVAHQPLPRARNVELHSEGVINNVLTASIEFDRAEDEDKLVSKYWFRFSSDCTDMGKLEPLSPPVLILQTDPLVDRYRTTLGPIRVPDGAQCVMLYAADLESQPFDLPVAVPLPQFRYPKPEVTIPSHCRTGAEGCFAANSTGTSCESLMGKRCCNLPMCVGCSECAQVRNLEAVQQRPRLYGAAPPCTDRWERQGFSQKFGFSCAAALRWGYMNCYDDRDLRLCFQTCALCDPELYPTHYADSNEEALAPEKSPALPDYMVTSPPPV